MDSRARAISISIIGFLTYLYSHFEIKLKLKVWGCWQFQSRQRNGRQDATHFSRSLQAAVLSFLLLLKSRHPLSQCLLDMSRRHPKRTYNSDHGSSPSKRFRTNQQWNPDTYPDSLRSSVPSDSYNYSDNYTRETFNQDTETDEFGRQLRPSDRQNNVERRTSLSDMGFRSSSPPIRLLTPPMKRSPTREYLLTASQASRTLTDEHHRKLVIFDLNGTLLRRSPRPSHSEYHNRSAQQGAPRIVYPRPYLPSLIEYLFHPTTRDWLDVMVWSSAQPYNVRDMVEKCFGKDEFIDDEPAKPLEPKDRETGKQSSPKPSVAAPKTRRLKAVWARDTLGLSRAAYNNKVLTIKDLSTPWAALNAGSPEPLDNKTQSDAASVTKPALSPSSSALQEHSALSTLLVDDSPEKCVLQPYNHLCVPEYDSTRMHDSGLAKWRADTLASTSGGSKESTPENCDSETQRKGSKTSRLGPKKAKVAERRAQREKLVLENDEVKMDDIMLALVGIFDTIKHETNVAAWVKNGGLWAGLERPVVTREVTPEETMGDVSRETVEPTGNDAHTTGSSTTRDTSEVQGPTRLLKIALHLSPQESDSHRNTSARSSSPSARSPKSSHRSLSSILASHRKSISPSPPASGAPDHGKDRPIAPAKSPLPMWFDSPAVVQHWAVRGRSALEKLGIEVEDGVKAIPP